MKNIKLCNKLLMVITLLAYCNVAFCQSEKKNNEIEILSLYDSIRLSKKNEIAKSVDLIQNIETKCINNSNPLCSTDSLEQLKGDVYLRFTKYYHTRDVDSAKFYVQKSLESYILSGNKEREMSAFFKSGSVQMKDGSSENALNIFNDYISFYKEKGNEYKVALGEYKLAYCYFRMGIQDSVIVICHRAIKVFEKKNAKSNLARSYKVIGLVYAELKQYESAKEYLNKALKIHTEKGNKGGQAAVITAMGNTVYFEGDTLGCINYYNKAGRLNKEVDNIEGVFVNYYNIANAFFQLTQYDSSLVYVGKALKYSERLGQRKLYLIEYKKGAILIELGKIKEGIKLLEKSFNSSLGLKSYLDARDMAKYLNSGYESLGDYKLALKYSNIHTSLKDSVLTVESNKKINEIKTKYETEKKEILISHLENTNTKQSRSIMIGGIGLLLISVLAFAILFLYKRIKGQKSIISKALKEKDILLREIHHRVKNNLQLISSLLTLQGRSIDDVKAVEAINESKSRVRSMALIHQDLYNKKDLTSVNVKEYLEKLTKELFLTYKVTEDRVTLKLDIQNLDIDVNTLIPLGLIINELITNCLKYAFPDNNNGLLIVSLKETEGKICLIVKDDGKGYDPSNVKMHSFGSTLLMALTDQLEGEMTIETDQGTSVKLEF